MTRLWSKSLNALYYACSNAKVDHTAFLPINVKLALNCIPEDLHTQPVFICIDDTMVEKFGTKFDDVTKLFDHAAHNGSNYLNGHCFVSLCMQVPVWKGTRISYLSVPVGYHIWTKDSTKLQLAAEMVRQAMEELSGVKNVILLCDSWYAKSQIFALTKEYTNLDLICNVRVDTALYAPVPPRTGLKGRPATRGSRLSIGDFELSDEKIGGYFLGTKKVITNLLKKTELFAFVTATEKFGGARRLFLSTVSPAFLTVHCAPQEKAPLNQTGSSRMQYIPLFLYSYRWPIEVSYYEHKTFWSLCRYMLRSHHGIEMMVNLINIAYCAMKILPHTDKAFSEYKWTSPQEFRFALSQQLREQVFLLGFERFFENTKKSVTFKSFIERCSFYKNDAA